MNGGPTTPRGDRIVWAGDGVNIFGRISRDGRYVSYVDWEKTGNLMLRDLAEGRSYALTTKKNWDESRESAGYSTISWDGKQIAYQWSGDFRVAPLSTVPITRSRSLTKIVDRPYEWSPDGNWISAHVKNADGTWAVGLIAVQDGSFRKLLATDWLQPRNMVFTIDGRWVLFDLRRRENPYQHDIYCAAVDGSSTYKLLDSAADERLVGFTGDYEHVLFSSNQGRTTDLWSQPFSNGKLTGTAVNIRADFGLSWIQRTTDSGTLYLTKTVLGRDLYVADLDLASGTAGRPSALKAFPYRGRPDWSPDGQKLSVVDCGPAGAEPCEILVWSRSTGKVRQLRSGMQYIGLPRWSPDGKRLVATGTALDGKRGLFVFDAETERSELVAEGRSNGIAWWSGDINKVVVAEFGNQGASYREHDLQTRTSRVIHKLPMGGAAGRSMSPDGKWVLFVSDRGRSVRVAPTGGGQDRELFRVETPHMLSGGPRLSWTMNGQAIVVVKSVNEKEGTELWLVPLAGQPRKLDIDVKDGAVTDFGGIGGSIDGKHIAVSSGQNAHEVWSLSVRVPKR